MWPKKPGKAFSFRPQSPFMLLYAPRGNYLCAVSQIATLHILDVESAVLRLGSVAVLLW